MEHIKRFSENFYNRSKFIFNHETKINDFKKEFSKIAIYDEDDYEQGDEPSMSDLISQVGDLCNKYDISNKELKYLIDSGNDIDGILRILYEEEQSDITPPKTFTDKQVLSMLVDCVMTSMGDEWIPQEDDNFKSFLKGYGLLELFNKEYNIEED